MLASVAEQWQVRTDEARDLNAWRHAHGTHAALPHRYSARLLLRSLLRSVLPGPGFFAHYISLGVDWVSGHFWPNLGFCGTAGFSAFYYHFTDDTNLWHWKASCNESNDIYFLLISRKFRIFCRGYWDHTADRPTSHASDATPLANIVTYLSLIRWCYIFHVRSFRTKDIERWGVEVADCIEID